MAGSILVRGLRKEEPALKPFDVQEVRECGLDFIRVRQDGEIYREKKPILYTSDEVLNHNNILVIKE